MKYSSELAYIVGVALGDGNISCPNGRATRLRITCDSRYPDIANEITGTLQKLFPQNKVASTPGPKESYFNISLYSNKLNECLPWEVGHGTKFDQNATVPYWILNNERYIQKCLKGLLQTDGSIYEDRGYRMVNFTNITEDLVDDVKSMIESIGYKPYKYKALQKTGNYKYTVRLSKNTAEFIEEINLSKT